VAYEFHDRVRLRGPTPALTDLLDAVNVDWVLTNVAGGGPPIQFAATAPAPPVAGRLYCNTVTGRVYMAGPVGGWFRVF
jgi:hypothetical protein